MALRVWSPISIKGVAHQARSWLHVNRHARGALAARPRQRMDDPAILRACCIAAHASPFDSRRALGDQHGLAQ